MQVARGRMPLCYLCGRKLPLPQCRKREGVRTEHVVPATLLKVLESCGDWPVALWVHDKCDRESKQASDTFVTSFTRLIATEPEVWKKGDLQNVRPILAEPERRRPDGSVISTIDASSMLAAIECWVKGMHSALYSRYLPIDRKTTSLGTPLPGAILPNNRKHRSALDVLEVAQAMMPLDQLWLDVRSVIAKAQHYDRYDGIAAWSENLKYVCTWVRYGNRLQRHRKSEGVCFWILDHPGAKELSESVGHFPRPWHGKYDSTQIPNQASILTEINTPEDYDRLCFIDWK